LPGARHLQRLTTVCRSPLLSCALGDSTTRPKGPGHVTAGATCVYYVGAVDGSGGGDARRGGLVDVGDVGDVLGQVDGGGTGDLWEPYYLSDPGGDRVGPASEFLRDLQAAGRPGTTQRSYALALLRWFRFAWAVGVPWSRATRAEARDFCRYLQLADKPARPRTETVAVPGKRPPSARFAPSTVAHCETVCRSFYAYHLEAGTGPIVNPFPLARPGRAHAHHNPMAPFQRQRAGLFRPRVPQRIPRQIPDSAFNDLFARLGSNRDRALVAFWSPLARGPRSC
jgi:hypothetical protein